MVTIQVQNLINFVAEVFAHSDSSAEEARRIATYLTTANLTGHDSHGVIRVPVYVRWKKMGSVVPDQTVEVVVDTPSLAVIDGKFGYGQTVTPLAVRIGNFFDGEISRYVDFIRATKPVSGVDAVLIPGDPEKKMRADRISNGVPLPDDTWAAIVNTAREVGVSEVSIQRAVS